jgi:hypothetical protein
LVLVVGKGEERAIPKDLIRVSWWVVEMVLRMGKELVIVMVRKMGKESGS